MIRCIVGIGIPSPVICTTVDNNSENYIEINNPLIILADNNQSMTLMPFPPLAKFGQTFMVNRSQITMIYEPSQILIDEYKKITENQNTKG